MKRNLEIIDEYLYTLELEQPKTRIIKNEVKPKRVEKQYNEKKPFKKPLVVNPVYRYTKDGDFVDKYINDSQMAKKLSWREFYLKQAADQERLYNGFLLTRTSYTKEQIQERFRKPSKQSREKKPRIVKEKKPKVIVDKQPYVQVNTIYQYNEDGNIIGTYLNAAEMANVTGWKHSTINGYSRKETVYNGFLISHTYYKPQNAKQRFTEALKRQQMTYVYKDSELVATLSTLTQVKELIKTTETLRRITYFKQIHKPIEGYILSNKPLESKENT